MRKFLSSALLVLFSLGPAEAQIPGPPGNAMPGTPTLGACGTSPALLGGSTDGRGQITVGTGITTSCALNFSKTYPTVPVCLATSNSATIFAAITGVTGSALTLGFVSFPGGVVWYRCEL